MNAYILPLSSSKFSVYYTDPKTNSLEILWHNSKNPPLETPLDKWLEQEEKDAKRLGFSINNRDHSKPKYYFSSTRLYNKEKLEEVQEKATKIMLAYNLITPDTPVSFFPLTGFSLYPIN